MRNIFFIGLLLIITISCEKESIEKPPIQNTWIESVYKTDTLVFDNQSELVVLNQEEEIKDEDVWPKARSLPYFYEIEKDSISLHWVFSSYSRGIKYYFQMDEKNDQIKIGNFFVTRFNNKNQILTFLRIN